MRRGFTLIELLVSLLLFSLIAIFLYGGIDQIRLMQLFYTEKGERFSEHERIRSLLYRDLAQADTMKIVEGDSEHTLIMLEPTRQTLHQIALPHVAWLVMRQDNALIRLESAEPIHLPLDPTKFYGVHKDTIATGCTTFRGYESATGRFAALFCDDQEIMVEVPR
ncbi:prepilin-type N-terminal cleavage/methylation domain-containing protein [Sulfuricurvum sp.]|uniref:prepilin-type N-terminal cleavage/methylation domain-containing protein n=1 Tax=Sulfuricurvum sp. TaxID=2025608 RepID=UPI003C31390F